jgi:hypothetical protein
VLPFNFEDICHDFTIGDFIVIEKSSAAAGTGPRQLHTVEDTSSDDTPNDTVLHTQQCCTCSFGIGPIIVQEETGKSACLCNSCAAYGPGQGNAAIDK